MKPLRCLYILISAFSTYVDAGYGSYNIYADPGYGTIRRFTTGNVYTITQAQDQQNPHTNRFIPPVPEVFQRIKFIPPPPLYNIIPPSPEPISIAHFFIPPPPVITTFPNIPPPPLLTILPTSPHLTNSFNNFIPPSPVIKIPQNISPLALHNIIPPSPHLTNSFNNFIPPSPVIKIPQNISPPALHNFIPPSPDPTSLVSILPPPVSVINIVPPSPDLTSFVNILPPTIIERPIVKGDYSFGTSDYYFTWLHNDKQYTYNEAYSFCHRLQGGWYVVSIESLSENQVINNIIEHYKLRFLWIGSTKQNGVYRFWDSGEKFIGLNFSSTGRFKTPQPDNAEGRQNNSPEDCLAILDKFYPNDGVTWHDIACYHKKVTICERPRLGL